MKPHPYDFELPSEMRRFFREMKGYLKNCNGLQFVDAGTDPEGRQYALDAFNKLERLFTESADGE